MTIKIMPFQEAYAEYKKGKCIRPNIPNAPSFYHSNSSKNNLRLIHVSDLDKYWQVRDAIDSIKEVKKYKVLYELHGEVKLTEDYFKDEDDYKSELDRYDCNSWEYDFIKLVEESERIFEEVE